MALLFHVRWVGITQSERQRGTYWVVSSMAPNALPTKPPIFFSGGPRYTPSPLRVFRGIATQNRLLTARGKARTVRDAADAK
jgi:hypothetical protein